MKTIKVKKLALNKTSIAQLDNFQKNQIKGGRRTETRQTYCNVGENCASWFYCG